MTQLILSPWSFLRATDAAGAIVSGAMLAYKIAGSSTPQNVYSDREGATPLGTSLTSNSAGRFTQHYLPAGVVVKVEYTYGATTETWDYAVVEPDATTLATTIAASIASASANLVSISGALELGLARNAQTGTSYTFVSGDRFKHITLSNASAIAVTLPQAGSAGFGDSWFTYAENIGDGVVTITPTTSTINGAATLILRKGQWALITSDGTNYRALLGGVSPGRQHIFIPASAMVSPATNGALVETIALGNGINFTGLSFDQTTQEFGCFDWVKPPSWDRGTVTFEPVCYPRGSSGGWVFALQGVAVSDDDALNASYGTEQTSTDSFTAAGDLNFGPESAAITIGGTPARGDLVCFRVKRVPADGSDTHNGDVTLKGVNLYYNTNAANDL